MWGIDRVGGSRVMFTQNADFGEDAPPRLKPSSSCWLYAGVEQAAEKLRISCEIERKPPSGAEAQLILLTLSARLKSCPDTSCLFR